MVSDRLSSHVSVNDGSLNPNPFLLDEKVRGQ